MIIQIKGKVKFNITLDPTTWIFDDRKVTFEQMEAGKKNGVEPILFIDNKAWNRDILESGVKPPTLNSEKKFKKQELLTESFVINMEPFITNAEPEDATIIRLTNGTDTEDIPLSQLTNLYFYFAKEGKRLYEDGLVDAFIYDGKYSHEIKHVTGIELI